MTKLTYEKQIDELPWGYSNSVSGVVVSEPEAKGIASEADTEIQKLKELLDNARWLLSDSGCKDFINEIEKAIYD